MKINLTEDEKLYLSLWDQYHSSVLTNNKEKETIERYIKILQEHYEGTGMTPPTKTSPMVHMFLGFIGGIDAINEVLNALENEER